MNDTIFALATAPGRAAVAVIRVSGPEARRVLDDLAGGAPPPRRASLRRLRDARGVTLDRGLVLWFPGPWSYTAEDCAELHLHGGMAIVDAVTRALLEAGAKLAKPGEFTRRAFENGKLELDQAEAVGDLVDAETEWQARQALDQLNGALGRRYHSWRQTILDCLADIEAKVDFPEEDVSADALVLSPDGLWRIIDALEKALEEEGRGRQVREGYRIAIVGAPNAGKSSLLNRLAGRAAAIVNEMAGTTRDVVEVPMVLGGYRVVLADMAGLRETIDAVEAEGVARATAWAADAALRLWVVDGAADDRSWRQAALLTRPGDLCLINKSDLPAGRDGSEARDFASLHDMAVLEASFVSGSDDGLRDFLSRRVVRELGGSDFPAATRARHADLLRDARDHLRRAAAAMASPELAAEDVRLAARALARVTGRVGVEDVLDRVFATFCIGK